MIHVLYSSRVCDCSVDLRGLDQIGYVTTRLRLRCQLLTTHFDSSRSDFTVLLERRSSTYLCIQFVSFACSGLELAMRVVRTGSNNLTSAESAHATVAAATQRVHLGCACN